MQNSAQMQHERNLEFEPTTLDKIWLLDTQISWVVYVSELIRASVIFYSNSCILTMQQSVLSISAITNKLLQKEIRYGPKHEIFSYSIIIDDGDSRARFSDTLSNHGNLYAQQNKLAVPDEQIWIISSQLSFHPLMCRLIWMC